jgi:hypothetical protein
MYSIRLVYHRRALSERSSYWGRELVISKSVDEDPEEAKRVGSEGQMRSGSLLPSSRG